jgi:hypothetical protein
MACQQIGFAHANCLVETASEPGETADRTYTAFVSLVEDDGTTIRPLVARDGHRVRIRAASEPLAIYSAITYLKARFGAVSEPGRPCNLGSATVGRPIAVED